MSLKARIAQGDIRVRRLDRLMRTKYQGIPNRFVTPHTGMGTGCDIIVWQYAKRNPKILELREVLNWDKFTSQGKKEETSLKRKKDLITSLTRKLYWVSNYPSKKRVYPTSGTVRFLDISYDSNLPKQYLQDFYNNRIEIMVWGRRETKKGWVVENNQGNKRYHTGFGLPTRIIGAKGR